MLMSKLPIEYSAIPTFLGWAAARELLMLDRMIPETNHTDHTTRCWWNPEEAHWVCPTGREESSSVEPDSLVDVRDMIVVHTALLREFRLAPAAVERVAAGGVRSAAVDRHLGFVCDLLHHHHRGEDELLWPLLRERVPVAARKLLDEVESQHVAIDSVLQTVTAARSEWVANPNVDSQGSLVAALEGLYTLLKDHLDLEESAVLPLAASVLTDAEWRRIGDAAAAALPKAALVLAFGMFAYEGDPVVLRDMLHSAPAVPRFFVPRIAPHVYGRRARRVHGTKTP